MPMTDTRKTGSFHKFRSITLAMPLLALALALPLAGCDDGNEKATSWVQWLEGKKEEPASPSKAKGLLIIPDGLLSVRDTHAGNYLAAQFAQYRQDWGTANKYLEKVLRIDSGNIELQQRAMVLAMQAGDANRAVMFARKVLDADNKNMLALLFIGVDHISRQEYSEAEDALSSMPKNGIADFIRPILLAWLDAPRKQSDLDFLMSTGALHAYHALLIADYLGTVKDPARYFLTVLAGGGNDAHMLETMADIYARHGQTELAEKIYDTLIEQAGDNPALLPRMDLLMEKRNHATVLSGALIKTPQQGAAEAFYNMARVLYNEHSDDSALVFARLAQILSPARDDIKILMARMMVRSDHAHDAIALFRTVSPGSPEYKESLRAAAELYEQEGKTDESIALLEESFAQTKDVNALIQIGDIYRRESRHQEAIKAYDRAKAELNGKISSDFWHLLYARGMSFERTGNMKRAEEDLQAALEFRPNHPYLLNYLGYSWAEQGKKLEESLALIEKAYHLKPDDGYITDSLGWVYYQTGRYEEAVAELEKAVELVPYDPIINDHLGDAYWQVGRRNEARFQWQRAMNHAKEEDIKSALQVKISDGIALGAETVMEAKKMRGPDIDVATDHQ
ncbi:MAG: tetratricopeptide repeat protein [Micavibrio sp.]